MNTEPKSWQEFGMGCGVIIAGIVGPAVIQHTMAKLGVPQDFGRWIWILPIFIIVWFASRHMRTKDKKPWE